MVCVCAFDLTLAYLPYFFINTTRLTLCNTRWAKQNRGLV